MLKKNLLSINTKILLQTEILQDWIHDKTKIDENKIREIKEKLNLCSEKDDLSLQIQMSCHMKVFVFTKHIGMCIMVQNYICI